MTSLTKALDEITQKFMLNYQQMISTLGHSEVIVGILIKPDTKWMETLHGLVDSCLTFDPFTLKYINIEIEEG